MASDGKKVKPKPKTNEEIIAGFQNLRVEQRGLANKISELELDQHEHKIVIDTLNEVDGDRKCFRMVGGILCERTVKDVLPVLKSNSEQMAKIIVSYTDQLTEKGKEVNEYKQKYSIVIRGQDDPPMADVEEEQKPRPGGNVLV